MAENLSDEMDIGKEAWSALDAGTEQEAVRAWARERIIAGSSDELAELLEASAKPRAAALRLAVRRTVEEQLISVRNQHFEVRTVAIPVCVVGLRPIDAEMLRIDDLVPAIRRILVRGGAVHAKGGGMTLLSRMITHGQLRELSYAQMFEASRQIFHSAVVSSAHRQRVAVFRSSDDGDGSAIGRYSVFFGYILGCIYQRASSDGGVGVAMDLIQHEVGALMRANFARLDMAPTVAVGRLAPIYDAMDEGIALRAKALTSTVLDEFVGTVTHVVTRYSCDPTDQDGTVMNVEFMTDASPTPALQLGLVFNHMEQGALGLVADALDSVLGTARAPLAPASMH